MQILRLALLAGVLLHAVPVIADRGVYQIGVTRSNGSRTIGSAVQLAPGKLVANCHTVRDASQIVVLHPRRQFLAKLDRADFLHDLCLLRAPIFSGSRPERVASANLVLGQVVIAHGFGSGFGMSAARGIITGLHPYDEGLVLRISARFPGGASGGGLFDEEGRLIGILTFRARDEDLNYALPVEWVNRLLDDPPAEIINTLAFWEDGAPAQPAFLRAARMESEQRWADLFALAQDWAAAQEHEDEAWIALGRARMGLGQSDEAVVALRRALALEPRSGRAWYWLASTYHVLGLAQSLAEAAKKLAEADSQLAERLQRQILEKSAQPRE
ncbi:MAG: tetratricopeptide repeat protein [Betaproteobacteria bacterium]|nr:tetratricopeptide repeat protein [Betaproteobacteria bacterium]